MLVVVATFMMLSAGAHQSEAAGAQTEHTDTWTTWAISECGVAFTGSLHVQTQLTLTPNGRLMFHYIANGEGKGVDALGRTLNVSLENKEVDHVLSPTPPNLGSGTLADWVAANMDIVVEINANFHEVVSGQGKERLWNHAIFEANHNGTQVTKATFTTRDCPP